MNGPALVTAALVTIVAAAFAIMMFGSDKLITGALWAMVVFVALSTVTGLVYLWLIGLGIIAV